MVLKDVWEEHLDEAGFQWAQWERALRSPDFNLEETAAREERLLAHLEGLEEVGALDAVVRPALDSEADERGFAALYALLSLGHVEEGLNRFHEAPPEVRSALRRALELSEAARLGPVLAERLMRADAPSPADALEVLTARQEAPVELLVRYSTHPDPRTRLAALRGMLPLPEHGVREHLPSLFASHDENIREAAMEVGLAAGMRIAWRACQDAVRARAEPAREAMVLLALGGDETDTMVLVDALSTEGLRAQALWALGFSGRVPAMEACLEYLEVPAVARLAAEAFSAMTGLRIEGGHALPEGEQPEGAPTSPEDQEDLDADLVPRPEGDLPWPHVSAVRDWWGRNRSRFTKGLRYLQGKPFSGPVLQEALASSSMRRRHVLARELAIRTHGRHVIPTRAFARRQHESALRARDAAHLIRGTPLASSLR